MKKLGVIFILLFVSISLHAQLKKPDFAFPASVSKEARTELKSAVARHDLNKAIYALLCEYVSHTLIEPDSIQPVIRLTEKTAAEFKGDKAYALFPALLADMYYQAYLNDSWRYDRRKQPIDSVPGDITEWSGEQFSCCINSLVHESLAQSDITVQLPLANFSDVISISAESATYYTTLLDFLYANALSISCIKKSDILESAYNESMAQPGSTRHMLWTAQYLASHNNPEYLMPLVNAYKENIDNPDAAILLVKFRELIRSFGSADYKPLFCRLADEYITKFPDSQFTNALQFFVSEFKCKAVDIRCEEWCAPGDTLNLRISNKNASQFKIQVYRIANQVDNTDTNRWLQKKELGTKLNGNLIDEVAVDVPMTAPFESDTIIGYVLDRPGTYVIIPFIDGTDIDNSNISTVKCAAILPIEIKDATKGKAALVNAKTGAPIARLNVSVTSSANKVVESSVTDVDGIATFNNNLKDYRSRKLNFTSDGVKYTFNGVWGNIINDYGSRAYYSANIITDRAIYHPGDSVQVLVIWTHTPGEKQMSRLAASEKVRVTIKDANYKDITTMTGVTDDFGRFSATLAIPTDGLTGLFTIETALGDRRWTDRTNVMVSDFKMADFEVKLNPVANDVPEKGDVTISGRVSTYSGMPVGGADLQLVVSTLSWWRMSPQQEVLSEKSVTADDGTFSIVVSDSLLKSHIPSMFRADITASSISGSMAGGSTTFSLGTRYNIVVDLPDRQIDGAVPFRPAVKVVDFEGNEVGLPLKWQLYDMSRNTCVKEGDFNGSIDLSDIKPDEYYLKFLLEDTDLADATDNLIVVYNIKSGIVPGISPIWTLNEFIDFTAKPGTSSKQSIIYGTTGDITYMYYVISDGDNVIDSGLLKLKAGYHTLDAKVPADAEKLFVTLFTLKHCELQQKAITINRKTDNRLVIEGECFRDKLIPGSYETWKIKVYDTSCASSGNFALALDMYNKALESLRAHNVRINFPRPFVYNKLEISGINNFYARNSIMQKLARPTTLAIMPPQFCFIDKYLSYDNGIDEMVVTGFGATRQTDLRYMKAAMPMSVNSMSVAQTEEAEEFELKSSDLAYRAVPDRADHIDDSSPKSESVVDYRDAEVPMAVWAPMLTTDDKGDITYTFSVPNANTTWRLQAVAWSKNLTTGSMMRDFVASKPVMVQPNLPRFLRAGDKAAFDVMVMNNSDASATIATTVEFFNPADSKVIATYNFEPTVDAMQSAVVTVPFEAPDTLDAVGVRVRARSASFTDGEQSVLRILPSEMCLFETEPFYLNPGDTGYRTELPDGKNARISLSFCENPAWTIVSALPGMREDVPEYANSAAAAIFSAAVAQGIIKDNPAIGDALKQWSENPTDSALVSMLERNADLKIALLNATPWVQAAESQSRRMGRLAMLFDRRQTDNAIKQSVKTLKKLQRADGGWAWGNWCDESSVWVTANVLDMLVQLRNNGWQPANADLNSMIKKALDYYDRKVEDTDMVYAIVRPQYTDVPISANGRKVIGETLKDIRKNWKKYSSPVYKSMAAEALWHNGDKALARELMTSVSQFGVSTPKQGMRFPSVSSLASYASILHAFATILPHDKAVDGIRQQLIVRKQATDWGSSVVTTEVVSAILSCGTCWTVDDSGAEVKAGDTTIEPRGAIETATGAFTADLSRYAGETLSVTTSGKGPAYGAVYSRTDKVITEVEPHSIDDLSIDKHMFVRRGTEWINADSLKVGDIVRVQLTIHNKRHMQYVEIIDERPAAFQPVDQLPGWLWCDGTGLYRENRDTATNLHVAWLSPGTYQLTYDMYVTVAGSFVSGVATIQSQYAPELSAHSAGTLISVAR